MAVRSAENKVSYKYTSINCYFENVSIVYEDGFRWNVLDILIVDLKPL